MTGLNRCESAVAEELVTQVHGGGYLLADGNYDVGPLHEAAGQQGYQLLAEDRRPNAGKGHRKVNAFRQRGIQLRHSSFGKDWLAQCSEIERHFGQATSFGGGMGPLPAWVRRTDRVRTWIWVKLLINAVRVQTRQHLTI